MSRDYYTLQPDKIYRIGKNYTQGRAGQKIQFITRHHLMYIGEGESVVNEIWNSRPASAHHVIGPTGRWVQTVYDNDTAWANASQWANQRTIAIEHSNNTGRARNQGDFHPDSWNISNETIISGARVAAAYCLYFNLGRPVYGKNIRDHFEFTATGCPVHLSGPRAGNGFGGRAGKYHQQWMDEAQRFYDELKAGKAAPKKSAKKESRSLTMNAVDQVNAHTRAFISGFFGPQIDALQEVWTQLRGPGGKGWKQLGVNDKGQNLTLVDAVAAIRQDLARIEKKLEDR